MCVSPGKFIAAGRSIKMSSAACSRDVLGKRSGRSASKSISDEEG
jgi:hypothetical protein